LHGVAQGFVERQRTLFEDLCQRLAFHPFHDQVVRADVVERADVGMIQRGDGPRLAFKTVVEFARGNLDGDGPAEACVGAVVHLAHAALADQSRDLIRAKLVSGRKPHRYQECISAKRRGKAASNAWGPYRTDTIDEP
jgi:hypothetical protein